MFDSKKSQNKFINDLNAINLPEKDKVLPAEAFISKNKNATSNFNCKKLYPIIPFSIAILVLSSVLILQIGLPNLPGLITEENLPADSNSSKIIENEILDNSPFLRFKIPSINWLVEKSDLIIIGNVLDNAQILQVGGEKSVEGSEVSTIYELPLTKNTVHIEKILYGNENSKDIIFAQLGLPGNRDWQIKLNKGDRIILFLKNKENNIYIPVAVEEGSFKITNDNKLHSFSNEKIVAIYNGVKVDVLIKDIENIISK